MATTRVPGSSPQRSQAPGCGDYARLKEILYHQTSSRKVFGFELEANALKELLLAAGVVKNSVLKDIIHFGAHSLKRPAGIIEFVTRYCT